MAPLWNMNTPIFSATLTPANAAALVDEEIELFTPEGGDYYSVQFLYAINSVTGPCSICTLTPKVIQDIGSGPLTPGGTGTTSWGPIIIPQLPLTAIPPVPVLGGTFTYDSFLVAPASGPLKFKLEKSGALDAVDYSVYLQINFTKLPLE